MSNTATILKGARGAGIALAALHNQPVTDTADILAGSRATNSPPTPLNALLFNGVPLLYNGQFILFTNEL